MRLSSKTSRIPYTSNRKGGIDNAWRATGRDPKELPTQKSLADKLGLTVWAVSAWEQGRNSPPSDVLLAICKLYGTSADYLLGLTDIDPSDEARKQRQRLTEEEQNEMHRYEEYLLWKRKK